MTEILAGPSDLPTWRTIRASALLNSKDLPDNTLIHDYQLNRTRFSKADQLSITFIISREAEGVRAWWTNLNENQQRIDLFVADTENGVEAQNVFSGIIDEFEWYPFEGLVRCHCRDYMALLLDTRIQSSFPNMTAKNMLKTAIAAAGLRSDLSQFNEQDISGSYWNNMATRLSESGRSKFQTAFDLVHYIAGLANCDFWAEQDVIHVAPSNAEPTAVYTLPIRSSSEDVVMEGKGITRLTFNRQEAANSNIAVHVVSYDSFESKSISVWWTKNGGKANAGNHNAGRIYTFRATGLSKKKCADLAKAKYDEIVSHGLLCSYTSPAITGLRPRQKMVVTGTNTSFDAGYIVQHVDTTYEASGSYVQNVELRTPLSDETQQAELDAEAQDGVDG